MSNGMEYEECVYLLQQGYDTWGARCPLAVQTTLSPRNNKAVKLQRTIYVVLIRDI